MALQQQRISSISSEIENELDFIINHLDPTILYFPRRIMTKKLLEQKIGQKIVYSEQETLAHFEESNYIDCRINAFRYSSSSNKEKWNPDLIFIDLDRKDFKSDKSFENALSNTLKNIEEKLGNYPTVLFTGGGYHIYQPIEGVVFENYDIFNEFNSYYDLFKEFLRFSKEFLSNNKADKKHNPSLNSCLLRIPGSINSKYNNKVKIVQKWNGYRPLISELLEDFRAYLIQKKIEDGNSHTHKKSKIKRYYNKHSYYNWIEEKILQTPFEDCRKIILSLILAPYLINIKKLPYQESFDILIKWLQKCDLIRNLDFNPKYLVKTVLNIANQKRIPPMKLETLRNKKLELYHFLQKPKHI